MDNILLEQREGDVVTLTINRPEKLNAMTKPLWQALGQTVERLSKDLSLRCLVLRGAGDRSFSPGNDIGEFATERANKAQAIAYGQVMHTTVKALANCPHPIVAQIHGICVAAAWRLPRSLMSASVQVQSLRRTHQESGSGDGLRRDGAVGPTGRSVPGTRDSAGGRIFGADEALQIGFVSVS